MNVSRRDFLKQAAVSAALSAAGAAGISQLAACSNPKPPQLDASGDTKTYTGVCRFCGTGCGVLVETKNGRIVRVSGDPDNVSNHGLLCVKGYNLSNLLYGEDRLTQPLIRDNPKTKGTAEGLREATWEEALDLVAHKLKQAWLTDKKRIALWLSGQQPITEGYACAKFWKAGLLSNNIDPNARLCMASAVASFVNTFQSDEPAGTYADLELADTFVTWGANMAEAHPVLFARLMARKHAGDDVRHFDVATIRTRTSKKADEVLIFRPGSDIAIANAICNYIIQNNLYDEAFLADHIQFKQGTENLGNATSDDYDTSEIGKSVDKLESITWEALKERFAPYTLEYASSLSGVPTAQIEKLAREYADPNRKVMSLWTMGVNQHNRGTWMNNCIYNIHFLVGKIARPGNNPFSLTGQPSACGTTREAGTFCHRLPADLVVSNEQHRRYTEVIWNLPEGYLDDIKTPGYHTVKMFRELSRGNIDFLWTAHNNWAVSMPNLTRFLGIDSEYSGVFSSFNVVNEVYPTLSTQYADVVFPVAMWMEREGQFGNGERHTAIFEKAVEAPGQAKWDLWVFMEVARRVLADQKIDGENAFERLFGEIYDTSAADFKGSQHEVNAALWEEYRTFSNPELNEKALAIDEDVEGKFGAKLHMKAKQLAPYEEYFQNHGLIWPVREVKDTWVSTIWRYADGSQDEGYDEYGVLEYGTAGLAHAVSFYKSAQQKPSLIFRPYEPPAEEPDSEYPFWFCTGRLLEHWHTGSMTRRIAELKSAQPQGVIYMNQEDAARLQIAKGDMVTVTSRYGTVDLPVAIHERFDCPPGTTFAAFFDDQGLINKVVQDTYCPISKEPDFKKTCVNIERAER